MRLRILYCVRLTGRITLVQTPTEAVQRPQSGYIRGGFLLLSGGLHFFARQTTSPDTNNSHTFVRKDFIRLIKFAPHRPRNRVNLIPFLIRHSAGLFDCLDFSVAHFAFHKLSPIRSTPGRQSFLQCLRLGKGNIFRYISFLATQESALHFHLSISRFLDSKVSSPRQNLVALFLSSLYHLIISFSFLNPLHNTSIHQITRHSITLHCRLSLFFQVNPFPLPLILLNGPRWLQLEPQAHFTLFPSQRRHLHILKHHTHHKQHSRSFLFFDIHTYHLFTIHHHNTLHNLLNGPRRLQLASSYFYTSLNPISFSPPTIASMGRGGYN